MNSTQENPYQLFVFMILSLPLDSTSGAWTSASAVFITTGWASAVLQALLIMSIFLFFSIYSRTRSQFA